MNHTVNYVLTDENIDKIETKVMKLIKKGLQNTLFVVRLWDRLKDTNKHIKSHVDKWTGDHHTKTSGGDYETKEAEPGFFSM